MPAHKGHTKSGGRQKGTPNKATEDLKEFYIDLLSGEKDNIKSALKELYDDDAYKYMMAIDKISNKVVANKKDITSDGEAIQVVPITGVNIIEDGANKQSTTETG